MSTDFEQNHDMSIVVRFLIINHIVVFYILQVFKEASTYRGKMKDILIAAMRFGVKRKTKLRHLLWLLYIGMHKQ